MSYNQNLKQSYNMTLSKNMKSWHSCI